MSNRAPAYRSFKKDYGGDPDSTILRDLHRRLMKVEIAFEKERIAARDVREDLRLLQVRLAHLKQLIELHHDPPVAVSQVRSADIAE